MSYFRDTTPIANSSVYRININSTFLKPKSNEAKPSVTIPNFKTQEVSTSTTHKFVLNTPTVLCTKQKPSIKQNLSCFDDLFNTLKGKLSKNEALSPSFMKFNPSEIYRNKVEFSPSNIVNEKLQSLSGTKCTNSLTSYLNKKRQIDLPKILNDMNGKSVAPSNDSMKKGQKKDVNLIENTKKGDILITNNYLFDKNNEVFKKNGDLQTPIRNGSFSLTLGSLNETNIKDVKSCELSSDPMLKKCEALLSCLHIYGFSYKLIFSSKKIYIEIVKKGSKLKYNVEMDRVSLGIIMLEKSFENQSKIGKCKDSKLLINLVDLEKFIKYEILTRNTN